MVKWSINDLEINYFLFYDKGIGQAGLLFCRGHKSHCSKISNKKITLTWITIIFKTDYC